MTELGWVEEYQRSKKWVLKSDLSVSKKSWKSIPLRKLGCPWRYHDTVFRALWLFTQLLFQAHLVLGAYWASRASRASWAFRAFRVLGTFWCIRLVSFKQLRLFDGFFGWWPTFAERTICAKCTTIRWHYLHQTKNEPLRHCTALQLRVATCAPPIALFYLKIRSDLKTHKVPYNLSIGWVGKGQKPLLHLV